MFKDDPISKKVLKITGLAKTSKSDDELLMEALKLKAGFIGQSISLKKADWREKVTVKLKIKRGKVSKAFAPLQAVWKYHL